MSTLTTTARRADLAALYGTLETLADRRVDVVAPAAALRARGGNLTLTGTEPIITEDGVTTIDGAYTPTAVADGTIADRLGIPVGYLRRMRVEAPDLWDANVNGWLHGRSRRAADGTTVTLREGDDRTHLLRAYAGENGQPGVARALLSDKYGVLDHLDVLTAVLAGVKDAGVAVQIDGCDLTDRRMYVRILAQEVKAYAPDLMRGYKSPFTGLWGDDNPTVFAGFVVQNSEVGAGAATIVPRLVFEVCSNGMTIEKDAWRRTHLGARMDTGLIRWNRDTVEKSLALVTAQTRDAVATFLDAGYVQGHLNALTEKAAKPLSAVDAPKAVEVISQRLAFPREVRQQVLDHFLTGRQTTVGGLMQAVTSAAQVVEDADTAAEMEAAAIRVLDLV